MKISKIEKDKRKLQYLETTCFDLPDNTDKLKEIELRLEKYKNYVNKIGEHSSITDDIHNKIYDNVCNLLDKLGKLSTPYLDTFDRLEELYILKYINTPELGKRIWVEHYCELNKPYTLLKNRCVTILENLDYYYKKKFRNHPPNYYVKSQQFFEK
jgi:hypothetical protein